MGYHFDTDPAEAEPDSDVYAVLHDGVVSVTPISLDLTSRTDLNLLSDMLVGREPTDGTGKNGRTREKVEEANEEVQEQP